MAFYKVQIENAKAKHIIFQLLQVCSNFNETFRSNCEIHQMRCFCEQEVPDRRCKDPEKYKHVHIEYYGKWL